MEPRIQYAKTKDGVSIAYSTLGDRMPLVIVPSPEFSHIQAEWQLPGASSYFERLAEERMVVRYDGRGTGLSDRDVTDFTLHTFMLDLDAVVARLGQKRFDLLGSLGGGPVATAYAASHPQRVSRLLLWCPYGPTDAGTPGSEVIRALIDKDWAIYTETLPRMYMGWSAGEEAQLGGALLRECVTQETLKGLVDVVMEMDATEFVPQVEAPTLVLCRREGMLGLKSSRDLASGIPDARLVVLEGQSLITYIGDSEAVLKAINEFLGEGEDAASAAELPEGMAVILFADIAESTALTEQLGDAAFRAKARELDTSLRSVIRESGGTPVEGKVLGDGVLAVFTSARQAIDCALRCDAAGEPLGLRLHLGIHAGDVIREGNNVYGGAVNIAARIAAASAPGEVLVSQTVRDLARTSAGVTFDDRGQRKLKGVEGRQRLFAVGGGG